MTLSPGNHGVIITHGIGDNMKPGNLLADFTNSLANALMESPEDRREPEIRRDVNLDVDPPSVTLQIQSPNGEKATWVCKEAFWGDAFPPPKSATVLWWLLHKNLINQIKYVWNGVYKDPANDLEFIPLKDQAFERRKHRKLCKWKIERYEKPTYRNISRKSFFTEFIVLFLAVMAYFVLGLIYVFQFLQKLGPLGSLFKWVRKFDPFLSRSLGDVEKYIEDGVWSANARARIEKVIIAMLNDQYTKVEDITIIAHSMGCVVAYDALAEGGKVAEEVKRLESQGKSKKITFVSVGSAINQVFPLAKKSSAYARRQFKRPLAKVITGHGAANRKDKRLPQDRFFWLDIYARRDPVPAGELDGDIIKQAGVDPELQVKRRKVINTDHIMADHTSYWANTDIVIPRIARAINGGIEEPWESAGITREKIIHRDKLVARLDWSTWMVIILLVVVCIVIGLKIGGIF